MTDRSTELHVAQVAHTKVVGAFLLDSLALGLWAVAGIVLLLGIFVAPGSDSGRDSFVGHFWFGTVPAAGAATVLQLRARTLRKNG